ncbi:MAG: hypothetical protein KAS32_26260 [Candidatus Peribacteraceae bacterium]|nr:hypothetical protein [Candidatus Peribacteraceae bacterium]
MKLTKSFELYLVEELLKFVFLSGKYNSKDRMQCCLKITDVQFRREVDHWYLLSTGAIGNSRMDSYSLNNIMSVTLQHMLRGNRDEYSQIVLSISDINKETREWALRAVDENIILLVDDNGIADDYI